MNADLTFNGRLGHVSQLGKTCRCLLSPDQGKQVGFVSWHLWIGVTLMENQSLLKLGTYWPPIALAQTFDLD